MTEEKVPYQKINKIIKVNTIRTNDQTLNNKIKQSYSSGISILRKIVRLPESKPNSLDLLVGLCPIYDIDLDSNESVIYDSEINLHLLPFHPDISIPSVKIMSYDLGMIDDEWYEITGVSETQLQGSKYENIGMTNLEPVSFLDPNRDKVVLKTIFHSHPLQTYEKKGIISPQDKTDQIKSKRIKRSLIELNDYVSRLLRESKKVWNYNDKNSITLLKNK